MPVFAYYELNDPTTVLNDSAVANGDQNGVYINGAVSDGTQAVLDGDNDFVKIYPSPVFQLDRGTLQIEFTQDVDADTASPTTVLSRDSTGTTDGGFRIQVMPDGSIQITHESLAGTEVFTTGPGFMSPGDVINLSYSWDATGTGGFLDIQNVTQATSFSDVVPNTLTMDMGAENQPWFIGAGQSITPAGTFIDVNEHFDGKVEFFSLSDTVDNPSDNQDPIAEPDTATTDEDVAVDIPVLANDSDPDGDTLTVTGGTAPNGTVSVNPDGSLRYVPNLNFNGTDTITYTISDPSGATATSTVTVTVLPVNDAPVAVDDTASTAFGVPVTIPVLSNDTDPDSDPLSVFGTPTSADGTVVVNPDGTLTFTPNPGFAGVATIDYVVRDPAGLTDTGQVTVTVRPDTGTGPDGLVEGGSGDDLIDFNYTGDPEGDMIDHNDALLPGEAPQDDIVLAGGGNDTVISLEGDDEITAGAGNDQVYAGVGNDFATGDGGDDVLEGGLGDDSLFGGADNDTVIGGEGDDSVVGGLGDDVVDGGVGDDTLDGLDGDDTLLGDDGADSATGGGGNDFIDTRADVTPGSPDRAFPGLYAADADPLNDRDTVFGGDGADTILTGDDQDVITAGGGADVIDAGVDDDSVTANDGDDTVTAGEGNDTVTGDLGDDLIFGGTRDDLIDPTHLTDDVDPDADNNRDLLAGGAGNDTIYGGDDDDTLSGGLDDDYLDGGIDEDEITGDAGNDTIIGGQGADTLTGGADRDVFIGATAGDVIDGSGTGDDFDTLDLRGVGPIRVTFDPLDAENGTIEFLDGGGATIGTATFVEIENVILPSGEGPTANPDVISVPEQSDTAIPVLLNDTDPDGQPLEVIAAHAEHGDVTINTDGTITYSPITDYVGPDTITYTITDPDGNTSTSTVAVTVTPVNDAPDAQPDYAQTPIGVPVDIPVLDNDSDPDGDPLSISGIPTTTVGTVDVNPDGTLRFTPPPGFDGTATITYDVTDGTDTVTTTVTVRVGGTPRDGIVFGTTGDDLIDATYVDPTDGDLVDANDALIPGDGPNDDRIVAGDGDDTVLAGAADDTIYGGAGDDEIFGNDGDEEVYGGIGDDTIITGDGQDVVYGGEGADLIDTRGPSPLPDIDYPGLYPADTDPLNDMDTVRAGGGNDTVFTGDDADLISGFAGDDYLDAGFDDDTVYGGSGRDTIIGSEGNDQIDGGRGGDLIFGGLDLSFPDAINFPDSFDLRPGNNQDTIFGNFGDDTIYGMDDDDSLNGGEGNDLVFGGVDDDFIDGGDGHDRLNGDDGDDTIIGATGRDTISGGAGNDSIEAGLDDDSVSGGDGDDSILGEGGTDSLVGDAGDDTIDGGSENDTIFGGTGADSLIGGFGDDLISLSTDRTPDTDADVAFGGADQDVFIGTGAGDTVFGGSEGVDFDILDLGGAGPFRLINVVTDSDGNGIDGTVEFLDGLGNVTGTADFENIERVICFTPGTMIATLKGEIPVEALKVGDRVITRDNGIQEIRWSGQRKLAWHDLAANPHLRPIMIKAGSLGNGLPERDMMLSPNHRVLVANDRTSLYFDEHEVLVAAKHLVGGQGIQQIDSVGTTYHHFMFDRHEVVLSNGAWTESFQPGDYSLKGLGNAQRSEIFELFPELKTEAGVDSYQAARKTLKRHEAALLVR